MTRRLEEMEAEIATLKAMQAKLEKEMGVAPEPANEDSATLPGSREEVDSRSVYVGNVHFACRPEEVQQHFESCGTVNRVTIKTNVAGQPKGFAYVEFLEREAVQGALETLNETKLHGRQLKVCAKRTNIPGMKKRSLRPRGFNSHMGSSMAAPYIPPYFTSPYGYGKAPPRFRRALHRRFSPYF